VVEEVDDLRDQVLLDLYLRRFRVHRPMFGLAGAAEVVGAAIGLPGVPVIPVDTGHAMDVAETRGRLARAGREELDLRKRRLRLLTFDDLLVRLRDALASEDGEALCDRLRARWDLILVDEFQDTDRLQWEVLERAFVAAGKRLVLIGDPKQAIYAFRGADVHAYLGALQHAGVVRTLDVNWRSDQDLIDAHDALLAGTQLGHPLIPYRAVRARHAARRLHGAPDRAASRCASWTASTPRSSARRSWTR
jgi:exodeoxyribonuclease V beta subunit